MTDSLSPERVEELVAELERTDEAAKRWVGPTDRSARCAATVRALLAERQQLHMERTAWLATNMNLHAEVIALRSERDRLVAVAETTLRLFPLISSHGVLREGLSRRQVLEWGAAYAHARDALDAWKESQ